MQASAVAVWPEILSRVSRRVDEPLYTLWFKKTVALSFADNVLEIGVPSGFTADWLETHYRGVLVEAASEALEAEVSIKFTVDGELFRRKRQEERNANNEFLEKTVPDPAAKHDSGRYTLENFVVGPCNSVAHAAAVQVARNPGTAYNPLFIHGGVGLGKTHLLLGIASALGMGSGGRGIEYVSAEAFTNRFVVALKYRTLDAFRQRYRRARLLVIDDIHFLANKPGIQDEFLNTYNALSRDGGQIVMASDSHPRLIGKMTKTLMTRFMSGMVARLDKPDFHMRLELARRKAAARGLHLDEEIADFVARNIKGSVRELEGAINILAAYANIMHRPITITIARQALRDLIESHCREVRLGEIDAVVTIHSGLSEGDLRSGRRTKSVSRARHIAMYLARKLGRFSYGQIGAHFGGRNHSSVASATKKISQLISSDEKLAAEIKTLEAEFGF